MKDIDKTAGDLAEDMPDVQENAIAAEKDKAERKLKEIVDNTGRAFNPGIHQTKRDGSPALSTRGHCKVRKRPLDGPSTIGGMDAIGNIPPPVGAATDAQAYQATGQATAQLIFMGGIAFGGAEWKPTPEENEYMVFAWAGYFQAKGIKDLPPGVVVVTAMLSYIGPRLTKPVTQSKLKTLTAWIKKKFKRGGENAAQPDSGDDGKRKDDSGDGTGSRLPGAGR